MTLAGTAGLLGLKSELVAAEPPPETTTLKLVQFPGDLCLAPQHVAEQLLRDEGFTDVEYLKKDDMRKFQIALASGEVNLNMFFAPDAIIRLDAGDPIVILAGGHIGCFELVGNDQIRAVSDLKGKTVAVPDLRAGVITFIASIAATHPSG
jgi:NitT/TauT family transport system substrate-binding protein